MNAKTHIPLAALTAVALSLGFAACYSAPFVDGWYRCDADDQCGVGRVCDDGVCCNPEGEPSCPTRARGNGQCPDGGTPQVMYADKDGDGYGDTTSSLPLCGAPALSRYVLVSGDCVDTPGVGAAANPDAGELCDAIDNDCDGIEDDGLPGSTYYQDSDNDGAGDPAVTRTFCAPPDGGWVVTSNDCDPTRNSVRPGGTEVCDGLDNDCANGVDDAPVGLQQDCVDSTQKGICQAGREQCLSGNIVCTSKVTKKDETCDGVLDEDCDGVVDNKPGCTGPTNLLGAAQAVGAGELSSTVTDPGFTACQKGNIVASENVTTNNVWTGNGANFHVFWVEKPTGSWDLSKAGLDMRVSFNARVTLNPNPTEPWHTIGQPIFMFCSRSGQATRIRWQNTSNAWMGTSAGPYTSTIPLAGNSNWIRVPGGSLSDVYRIEMIVKPSSGGGGTPSFQINWLDFGF